MLNAYKDTVYLYCLISTTLNGSIIVVFHVIIN